MPHHFLTAPLTAALTPAPASPLPNLQVVEYLLSPHCHGLQTPRLWVPEALTQHMQKVYNTSQLKAMMAALKTKGTTLIQGPPGTGKTKTILGILSTGGWLPWCARRSRCAASVRSDWRALALRRLSFLC